MNAQRLSNCVGSLGREFISKAETPIPQGQLRTPERSRSMQRRALLIVGFTGLLSAAQCKNTEQPMGSSDQPTESLAQLGADLHLMFPQSARIIGVHRSPGGMDDAVRVKLEMAKDDLAAFLARTQVDVQSFRPGTRGMLGSDRDFWDPHRTKGLRTAQLQRAGARALNVGVDDSGERVAVLYIVEHGT
jgi:hypothetical protein